MPRLIRKGIVVLFGSIGLLFCGLSAFAQDVPSDYQEVLRFLDRKGDFKTGVLKVNIPRSDLKISIQGFSTPTPFGFGGWIALTKSTDGSAINTRMGLNTWAAFVGTQGDAAIAGDIAMLENEVTPVLKVLRKNGLDVVAIHHHMTEDRPIVIFLHYWGRGPAEKLATGFKTALDELGKGVAAHAMAH